MRRQDRSLRTALSILGILFFGAALAHAASGPNAFPGGPTALRLSPEQNLALQTPAPTGRIIVKFAEATGLQVKDGKLDSRALAAPHVEALLAQLSAAHGGLQLRRHFSRSPEQLDAERLEAEGRAGHVLPNLNRYAQIVPAASLSRAELLEIVAALSADPAIEAAFLEPVAVPAALGFDAFTGTYDPSAGEASLLGGVDAGAASRAAGVRVAPRASGADPGDLPTPDYTSLQGYLDPAPTGVNAEGVWGISGGRGQTVKVIDIEGAWLWTHEDLVSPFFTAGGEVAEASWRNHGTAVLGEIRGTSNSYGITGIAHQTQVGGASIAELSVADAINTAAAALDAGDLFVIELHSPGPNATGSGQYGYVCMEYWLDNFEAIQIASANGRICCEAAGNGEQNLDDPVYAGLFDRNVRDSGAILCGASNGSSLEPAGFTNYGSRVDLHGWGYNVVTCGYGNLQGGDETEWYTSSFSGTSSATPIVAGSVAALQGMVKAAFGIPLNAKLARDILVETGTPQSGAAHIGPRPNLTAAWAEAQAGIGQVAGTVTAAGTGELLEGVAVTVQETGARTLTDAGGGYALPLRVGSYTLQFDSFYYYTATAPVTITSGATTPLSLALTLLPTVEISGTTLGDDGVTNLAGMRVTPRHVPIAGTTSDELGDWWIAGFPMGRTYAFLFDGLPGYGADFAGIEIGEPRREEYGLFVQVPEATADFEANNGGFSGDAIWAYGTPAGEGGPTAGFSGTRCWGVGMTGNYDDGVSGRLTSASYNFADQEELYLSFHYWCETEADYDGATVEVRDAAGAWVGVTPLTEYNSMALGGLDYRDGWSGSTGGWVGAVFDLAPYISSQVAFRVEFGSDEYVNEAGFWIDDVTFDTGDVFSAIEQGASEHRIALLSRGPNPFFSRTHLALIVPRAQDVDVAVFDPAGRRVRTLKSGRVRAGMTAMDWDGRDDRGAAVGSGVYFVRMAVAGETVTRRVVLSR